MIFLGLLFAALTMSTFATLSAGPAHADEVGTEEYDYVLSGNVQFNQEPLEGVLITVEGSGYEASVKTGVDGKWKVGVPEKAT